MQTVYRNTGCAGVILSIDELVILSNALNELHYGVCLSTADLETRLGCSIDELAFLLNQILHAIDSEDSGAFRDADEPTFSQPQPPANKNHRNYKYHDRNHRMM
jgi:hypothetical protein